MIMINNFTIRHRAANEVIYSGDHYSMVEAVETARKTVPKLRMVDLARINLNEINLAGADLTGADFSGSDLFFADLGGTDLRLANFVRTDLSGADLNGANLVGAEFTGANLIGVNLAGAKINWNSHDLISRILLSRSGHDLERRKVAGLILVSRDWCWNKWLSIRDSEEFQWAIDTLAGFVQDGDHAPPILRERSAFLKSQAPA